MPFGVRTSPVDKGEDFYACTACPEVFVDRKTYIKHLKDEHGLVIKPSDVT